MGNKIKLVMVDDEEDLCLIVKANLEGTGGFEVTTVSRPQEAVGVIEQTVPDVILLDVVMPEVKGQEIIAALKKSGTARGIPVIIVSGKGEMVFNKRRHDFKWMPNSRVVKERGELPDVKGAEALAQAYGVDDYVSKPFTTELLVQVIHEVLDRRRKAAEPEEEAPEF